MMLQYSASKLAAVVHVRLITVSRQHTQHVEESVTMTVNFNPGEVMKPQQGIRTGKDMRGNNVKTKEYKHKKTLKDDETEP
ncbi:hypothetical protein JOB18_043165 [Solea senegalensis]|uniref:Uncharacterized protein n=1 Tax=Solea senegalensis TaxID=28829 RepID=A0AAV6SCU4_SOLSE|nr:hypothetical protein JOB18_043165 [Solea senegalensis]